MAVRVEQRNDRRWYWVDGDDESSRGYLTAQQARDAYDEERVSPSSRSTDLTSTIVHVIDGETGEPVNSGTMVAGIFDTPFTRDLASGPAEFQFGLGGVRLDILTPDLPPYQVEFLVDGYQEYTVKMFPEGTDWSKFSYPAPINHLIDGDIQGGGGWAFSDDPDSVFTFKVKLTGSLIAGFASDVFLVNAFKNIDIDGDIISGIGLTLNEEDIIVQGDPDANPWVRIWLGTDGKLHAALTPDGHTVSVEVISTADVEPGPILVNFAVQQGEGNEIPGTAIISNFNERH